MRKLPVVGCLLYLVAVAGADGAVPPATTKTPATIVPCPKGKPLTSRVSKAFKLPKGQRLEDAECAEGRFPRPGWLLTLHLIDRQGRHASEMAVLDPRNGARLTRIEALASDGEESSGQASAVTADLDGDGIDEAVVDESTSTYGEATSSLSVHRLHGNQLEALDWSHDYAIEIEGDKDVVHCAGEHRISDPGPGGRRALVFASRLSKGPDAQAESFQSCSAGSETWELVDGKMVKTSEHPLPPCPTGKLLAQRLADVWKLPAAKLALGMCGTGSFPAPGWVFELGVEGSPGAAHSTASWVVLDAKSGRIVAAERGAGDQRKLGALEDLSTLRLVDLNRDGIDEIVTEVRAGHPAQTTLVVLRLAAPRLVRMLEQLVELAASDAGTDSPCSGSYTVSESAGAGRRLVVTGEIRKGAAPALTAGCLQGTVTYTMKDNQLSK